MFQNNFAQCFIVPPLKEREKIMAKMNTVKRRILFFHIEEKTCSQGQKGHHIKGITCDERF